MTTLAPHGSRVDALVPGGGYWSGTWQDGSRRRTIRDPQDGAQVGVVAEVSAAETHAAVTDLLDAWQQTPWPVWRRRECLDLAAARVEARAESFARLISAEGVKTLTEARREVTRTAETLRLSARAAARLTGTTVPFQDSPRGAEWLGWTTREPIGLVAAITPFNDPLNLAAHKVGPALIAGNPVVLKPAEQTPLTGLALAQVLLDAGVPPGLLAVLPGAEAGPALVADPRVAVVSFTGGSVTGDRIAAGGRARKLLMELGGNNAVIVCADASVPQAARLIVDAAFGVAGQNCLSVQRVFVAEAIADELRTRIVELARALRVGRKEDPDTDIGPMVSEVAARRVESAIGQAVATGAVLHTGGGRSGTFVEPTVLTAVPAAAQVRTEEMFGPVVLVDAFATIDEAITGANATENGMQAGVLTHDLDQALRIADGLRVGAVLINDSCDFRADGMPFGGMKRSGIGREGPDWAVEELTVPKIVAVHRSTG
ncbi:aldehyde dehydrogenase family protein [Ruania alba]|uniref:Glyceraldehyde-3-phosphate dehydrogenase (NADP+) n=1 Tax=Ruania alba TaxID=648782 RepID=A0A1H5HMW1_9MICO|nr:aldehyde dehydrogenase family protein [Ruania alba]SEE29333.1 glyceraldehyde-3-phosphate dehydrogenase (NADP+) [Ruania alba]